MARKRYPSDQKQAEYQARWLAKPGNKEKQRGYERAWRARNKAKRRARERARWEKIRRWRHSLEHHAQPGPAYLSPQPGEPVPDE